MSIHRLTVRCYTTRWAGKTFLGAYFDGLEILMERRRGARKRLRAEAAYWWGNVRFLKGKNKNKRSPM